MTTLKKYANRKIYGELDGKKGYLTLDDVANLIRQGKQVQVVRHDKGKPHHGQDITQEVLKEVLTRLVIPDTMVIELIKRHRSKEG